MGHMRRVKRSIQGPYSCQDPPVHPATGSSGGRKQEAQSLLRGLGKRPLDKGPAQPRPPAQLYRGGWQFVTPEDLERRGKKRGDSSMTEGLSERQRE